MNYVGKLFSWLRARSVAVPNQHATQDSQFSGYCSVCGKSGGFVKNHYSYREGYRCPTCGASYRYRAQANAIISVFSRHDAKCLSELVDEPEFGALRIYEPGISGPNRRVWRNKCHYQNSFFWPDVPPGSERDGVQCQNLESLTYEDAVFDAVITSDIFEHVRNPMAGFNEIKRVLKPGGVHIFSVPVNLPMKKSSVKRVDTSGDLDVHLMEPRYHGDGAGGKSLVYTDFGEDLLMELDSIGFDTEVHVYHPIAEIPESAATFISRKRMNNG